MCAITTKNILGRARMAASDVQVLSSYDCTSESFRFYDYLTFPVLRISNKSVNTHTHTHTHTHTLPRA